MSTKPREQRQLAAVDTPNNDQAKPGGKRSKAQRTTNKKVEKQSRDRRKNCKYLSAKYLYYKLKH